MNRSRSRVWRWNVKKTDERLYELSEKLAELSAKAADASAEAKEARELRQEKVQEKMNKAKGDVAAMQERLRIAGEESKSRLSSQLLKVQMTIEARIQDRKEAIDKKKLERYMDRKMAQIQDEFASIDYLISDAKLAVLELFSAADEYDLKYGTGGEPIQESEAEAAEETDKTEQDA